MAGPSSARADTRLTTIEVRALLIYINSGGTFHMAGNDLASYRRALSKLQACLHPNVRAEVAAFKETR